MQQQSPAIPHAAVIGGITRDIGGIPFAPLVPRDSNPGRVRVSLGGVGRNIAHNMSLLGLPVRFFTALGEDDFTPAIEQSCTALGIDLSCALRVPGLPNSTYLFIAEQDGDMALALSDMALFDRITPDYLTRQQARLDEAALVVADTNLPAETLVWLAEHCKVPLFADPVSTTKARRLTPVLGALHTIKPNRLEAALLSGVPIAEPGDLPRAAEALLRTGLKRVFISLGGDGVYAADHTGGLLLPCLPGGMASTTGCGDAFMSALAWAHMNHLSLEQAARAGLAAAAIAMEGAETINPAMSEYGVKSRANL